MPAKMILVVEDNAIQREGLAVILRQYGYTVSVLANGIEATDYLQSGQIPDLILLDMMMPICDGWRFLTQRTKNPALASIPVIIMTGLGNASEEWATSLGAGGMVRKPLEVAPLLTAIEKVFGK